MPFALVVIGLILIVTGARDTYKEFGTLVAGEFTGEKNFTYWVVAIGAIGMLGYSETLRPFSRAFLALILIAMVIANRGLFDQFTRAINTRVTATPAPVQEGPSIFANENIVGSGMQAAKVFMGL